MKAVHRTVALIACALLPAACAGDAEDDMEVAEQPAAAAPAPADASLAQYAGTWDAVAILESGDTVNYTMSATADTTGWTITLPGMDAMPLRIVSATADSVVTEVGPYASILRDGVQVTTRSVTHVQDGRMSGTMEATYEGGEGPSVVQGQVEATRAN